MNNKEKIDLIIKNFNENLPLEIEFGQMANFSIFPKILTLSNGKSARISAIFCPKQIGKLLQNIEIKIRDKKSRKFQKLEGISFPLILQGSGKGRLINPEEKILRDEKYVRPLTGQSSKLTNNIVAITIFFAYQILN